MQEALGTGKPEVGCHGCFLLQSPLIAGSKFTFQVGKSAVEFSGRPQGSTVSSIGDSPGIRVIPPLLYVGGFLIGYALEFVWPVVDGSWRWSDIGGIALICSSFFLIGPAIWRFRRASTPFDVRKPATALIKDGPYRYSRNPGYLALTLLYLGVVLLVESVWAGVVLIPVLVVMVHAVIRKEEAHLENVFGEEYRRYKAQVRRWV